MRQISPAKNSAMCHAAADKLITLVQPPIIPHAVEMNASIFGSTPGVSISGAG